MSAPSASEIPVAIDMEIKALYRAYDAARKELREAKAELAALTDRFDTLASTMADHDMQLERIVKAFEAVIRG